MNPLSRRSALRAGVAAAVAATIPTVAVAGDHKLLSEIVEFRPLFSRYLAVGDQAHAAWNAADTDPDKPPMFGEDGKHNLAVWDKHWQRYGYSELAERWNDLGEISRRRSVRLFAIPAYTLAGVLAKTKLAHEMSADIDESFDSHDDNSPHCWTRQVQCDLERLAKGGLS